MTKDNGFFKGDVVQTMDYYPFGAEFCDNSSKSYVQNHKYNGKEFDHMHGLNTYDYGARQYNPVTARWDRMDPHSENYYPHSPFAYCANNPVRLIDPDGMDWLLVTGDKVYWYEGDMGDTSSNPTVFNATSGYVGSQIAEKQGEKDAGPTPEGKYHMDLGEPFSDKNAELVDKGNGQFQYARSNGGIETLSFSININGEERSIHSEEWGSLRVRLIPDELKYKEKCKA